MIESISHILMLELRHKKMKSEQVNIMHSNKIRSKHEALWQKYVGVIEEHEESLGIQDTKY